MLFDEGAFVDEELYAVRGQELFELEAVDARGVAPLDVEEDVVVIDHIPDLDPEGLRVAEGAEGDAVDRDEGQDGVAAVRVEYGVDAFQAEHKLVPVRVGVQAIDPQGVPALTIEDGHATLEPQKVLVGDRDVHRTVMRVEVGLQPRRNWERLLFLRNELIVHALGLMTKIELKRKKPRKSAGLLRGFHWA